MTSLHALLLAAITAFYLVRRIFRRPQPVSYTVTYGATTADDSEQWPTGI